MKEVEKSKLALDIVKNEIRKDTKPMVTKNLRPGSLVFFTYNAKFKQARWDKTPMVFVLSLSQSYMLGLNFHYLPVPMRRILYKFLWQKYGKQIEQHKHIVFNWSEIKPFVIKLAAPVLRLYIRKRISNRGISIPYEKQMDAIELRVESFIPGSPSSEKILQSMKKS